MANFLYNGVRLRDICSVYTPELQKTHPFAVLIFYEAAPGYHLVVSKNEAYVFSGNRTDYDGPNDLIKFKFTRDAEAAELWGIIANEWGGKETSSLSYLDSHSDRPAFWANYDLRYKGAYGHEDGTLYLAASDPVPVSPVNPAALMQGFSTMLSLKK